MARLYENSYEQGFTTDLPSDDQLSALLAAQFRNTEKDYHIYIDVLRALGLKSGHSILDFGCSWGYGSWQLKNAGYRVFSYEVSGNRAEFARTKLGCTIVNADFETGPINCLFSAHVIEHLQDPNLLWNIAGKVLGPDGVVVSFLPNGCNELESVYGQKQYNRLWGQVHPLLIGAEAAVAMAERHGYTATAYSSPYDLDSIGARHGAGKTLGEELLLVAEKRSCLRRSSPVNLGEPMERNPNQLAANPKRPSSTTYSSAKWTPTAPCTTPCCSS